MLNCTNISPCRSVFCWTNGIHYHLTLVAMQKSCYDLCSQIEKKILNCFISTNVKTCSCHSRRYLGSHYLENVSDTSGYRNRFASIYLSSQSPINISRVHQPHRQADLNPSYKKTFFCFLLFSTRISYPPLKA